MRKRRRWWIVPLVVVVGLAVILAGGWLILSRQPLPKTKGTVRLSGLSAPVEVYRDPQGIPHIYASTSQDLFFAQGYVHAQDRFWQMEFWRRIGAGRLSELFGPSTLGQDKYLRTMGFARLAPREYAALDPDTRAILQAYAQGVNAYILKRRPARLGLEFALLGLMGGKVEIEPWTPLDTLTWAHVMSQDLCQNYESELYRLNVLRQVGSGLLADLMPAFRSDFPYILPDDELDYVRGPASRDDTAFGVTDVSTALVGGYDPAQGLALAAGTDGEGIGSNSWVLSGERTASGMPILANDPHLAIQMPSIWYEVGLHCAPQSEGCPYDLRGFSFAGVPGIVIGHNDRIAWGLTNAGPDVQDLYVERLNPEDLAQYQVKGKWVDMDIIREEIIVRGQAEPAVLLVRQTRHGPIISDLESFKGTGQVDVTGRAPSISALALRWVALEPSTAIQAMLRLGVAQNYAEFREALTAFDAPSQSFVYADVEGNIGYQMPGKVPIRARGDGSLPVPGWTDAYEWVGYVPYDDLPRAYNPKQGYIATANQPVVSAEYPYLLSYVADVDKGYRASRIVDLIEAAGDGLTLEDVAGIQADGHSASAAEVVSYLGGIPLEDSALLAARDRLLAWDGQMHMDSAEGALYGYFWVALMRRTFGDQLPAELWPGHSHAQGIVYHLLQDRENGWWDDIATPERETREEILAAALADGHREALRELGRDPDRWTWGAVHTATFANQSLGECGIGLIERIFNRGPVATSGGTGILNATSWKLTEPFVVNTVPSMRQIIDLGELANSRTMHTTGQSGHPAHRHYDDLIDPWRTVQYHPMLWERGEIEAQAEAHLRLQPRK